MMVSHKPKRLRVPTWTGQLLHWHSLGAQLQVPVVEEAHPQVVIVKKKLENFEL